MLKQRLRHAMHQEDPCVGLSSVPMRLVISVTRLMTALPQSSAFNIQVINPEP